MAKKAAQKAEEKKARKWQNEGTNSGSSKKPKKDKHHKETVEDETVDDDHDDVVNYADGNGEEGDEGNLDDSDDGDDAPLKILKRNTTVKGGPPGLTPMSQAAGTTKKPAGRVSGAAELDSVRYSAKLTDTECLCTVCTSPSMLPTSQPACLLASLR